MYNAEEVRARFNEEVQRMIAIGTAINISNMEKDLGIQQGRINNLKTEITLLVNPEILTAFVSTYRRYDVSYEYIYEGKRPAQSYSAIKEDIKKELCAHLSRF